MQIDKYLYYSLGELIFIITICLTNYYFYLFNYFKMRRVRDLQTTHAKRMPPLSEMSFECSAPPITEIAANLAFKFLT